MTKTPFVHLHTHSEYSLLDGACRVKDMVRKAAALEMPAVALTDHGVMYGAIHFYEAAKDAGVKPIIGCEVYVARGSRSERSGKPGDASHLTLLARDQTGYKNLLKIVTAGHLEGYYYKPRVDREVLGAHSEGIIALSGCLGGEVAKYVVADQDESAMRAIGEFQEIFGADNYFLEIQDHGLPAQRKVNEFLVNASTQTGAPLVATNDVHYLNADDADPHGLLLCIQTGATINDPGRFKYDVSEYYFKTGDEMQRLFGGYPGAIERTVEIAERCNLDFTFGRAMLPDLAIPGGLDPEEYLTQQAWAGLDVRYPNASAEIRERMEYELRTIIECGFAKYLLIVQDFATFARESRILAGVRGSAAGSLVCYCLGITSVDPIFHRLTFERFLNPERKQMPDVDFDFQDDRRGEVIEYVSRKYGEDHVAQIVTFGTLAARAAIRDAGRAMEIPLSEVDRVAKMIPTMPIGTTISEALKANPDLRTVYDSDASLRALIDMARKLEGISRHSSTHAAGVIVAQEPLVEHVPLQRSADGALVTQYDMDVVGKIGLLKMDFLGLINLSIIQKCIDLVKENRDVTIELDRLPMDDAAAFELLSRAETTGLFQLESAGMRRNIKDLKPQSVSELAAMVALYRPGPMAHIPRYIASKFGRSKIEYVHERLEPILKETYGVIVYQDQVLQIVQAVAGFSLGHADILRRAMGKKDPVKMAEERQNFVEGASKNGVKESVASKIFDLIEPFAGYAFNKAHAVCYGTVAYQTAYLKANYPVEYLTALLDCHAENQEKVALYIEEARRLGIEVLPPDINQSDADFTIAADSKSIRFGLSAIKNCGRGLVEALVEERRQNGSFKSVADFVLRAAKIAGFNRSAFECLAKVGALAGLHPCRKALATSAESIVARAARSSRSARSKQIGLFDNAADDLGSAPSIDIPDTGEYERAECLAFERDLLGLYVSDHPLNEHARALKARTDATVVSTNELEDGAICTIGGVITSVKHLITKKGDKMAFLTIEDLTGVTRVTVFPRVFAASGDLVRRDALVIVTGKVQHADSSADPDDKGPAELICESMSALTGAGAASEEAPVTASASEILDAGSAITIRLDSSSRHRLLLLKEVLERHAGRSPVFFKIGSNGDESTIVAGMRVEVTAALAKEVQGVLGAEALAIL